MQYFASQIQNNPKNLEQQLQSAKNNVLEKEEKDFEEQFSIANQSLSLKTQEIAEIRQKFA